MRILLVVLLVALPFAAAPAAASSPPTHVPNAVYADAAGDLHLASFSYEGPCDGLGTVTVQVSDTGQVLAAQVSSRSIGGTCGASLSCLDCPPVPQAYAWELTGLDVVLVGGGPAYYDAYASRPLAYSLSGQYLGGVLTAWGVSTLGASADPACQAASVDTWAVGAAWHDCYGVEASACTHPAWYGGRGLLGGWVCEERTTFPPGPTCFLEIVGPDLVLRYCLDLTDPDCLLYTERWGKEGEYFGKSCVFP